MEHRPAAGRGRRWPASSLGVAGAWVVERTDVPGRGWWHGLLCAPLAVPAFVNGYGWVSTTHAVQSFPRRGDGRDAVLLPSRLPADRRRAAAPRPRRRGGRDGARQGPVERLPPGHPAGDQPGRAGRRPARRPAPAGRVRRPPAPQLPDAHDGDPAAVRDRVQRPRGHPPRPGPGHVLPAPARPRAAAARAATAGPGRRGRQPRVHPDPPRPASAGGRRRARALVVWALGVPLLSLVRWLVAGHLGGRRPGRAERRRRGPPSAWPCSAG